MTRGIKVEIEQYLTSLKPYLIGGATLHDACLSSGIPYMTVKDYEAKDEGIRKKILAWQNVSIWDARKCLAKGVKTDPDLALKYLERKRKDEFSTKNESEILNVVRMDNVVLNGKELTFDFGKKAKE